MPFISPGIVLALLGTEHYFVASVLVLNAVKGFYNAVTTFSDVHQDLHRKLKLQLVSRLSHVLLSPQQ